MKCYINGEEYKIRNYITVTVRSIWIINYLHVIKINVLIDYMIIKSCINYKKNKLLQIVKLITAVVYWFIYHISLSWFCKASQVNSQLFLFCYYLPQIYRSKSILICCTCERATRYSWCYKHIFLLQFSFAFLESRIRGFS